MNAQTHRDLARFIWSICNLLRGPYKRNEYRKVILPLTVLRRFDSLLEPTKSKVLEKHIEIKTRPETVVRSILEGVTGYPFYNLSKLDMRRLLDDPNQLAPNLNAYINGFSKNVRDIMQRFAFDVQISRMAEKNLLFNVIKAFCDPRLDLSFPGLTPAEANLHMGYVFEELIRIGAEQSNEEAGEHFTPREVIRLMVNLLLTPEQDLRRSHVIKTIYDPACGTGGMLSEAAAYITRLNSEADPVLFGQDWNDEAWAVCQSDMLIKGANADNIILGDTFTKDGFDRDKEGKRFTFDYMLANPPFGVEWKQQQRFIVEEAELGHAGRFGAGLPRVDDGAFLFLQHMIAKMRPPEEGGSRIAIVFSGSSLFAGEPGGGTSNIRQWIIENDWLEAIIALPEQLFYNTGIATYVWVLTNRKEKHRKGRIQLIDARVFWVQMEKSLGNKRRRIGDPEEKPTDPDHIADLTRIHAGFKNDETRRFQEEDKITKAQVECERIISKVFDNADFGFWRITVERPLRLNFQATPERIARLEEETAFRNLAGSTKKQQAARAADIAAGEARQQAVRDLLAAFAAAHGDRVFKDRREFLRALRDVDQRHGVRLAAPEIRAVLNALGERDPKAEICWDRDGNPEPDPDLRDTENVPFKDSIPAYMAREVLPHAPDAWVDETKTKIGYEIPLNRHFYIYEPPRPLDVIAGDIRALESEIVTMLADVAT